MEKDLNDRLIRAIGSANLLAKVNLLIPPIPHVTKRCTKKIPEHIIETIRSRHWSERELAAEGVSVSPALVNEALKSFWPTQRDGGLGQVKAHLTLDAARTEGALIGFFGNYSGLKDIYRGPTDPTTGPVRSVDIILREKKTGNRLFTLEAISVSNGRTGWIAPECIDALLPDVCDLVVCLIGAGQLARAVLRSLDNRSRDQIKHILIFSKSSSNERLVHEMQKAVAVKLIATADRSLLRSADLLITATGSKEPVVTVDEIGTDAVTLALGIDELPAQYFDRLIGAGAPMLVDDMEAVEKRGVDAVAYYYARKGQKLTVEGKRDGVINIADFGARTFAGESGRAAHMATVGLASQDIAVTIALYESLVQRLYEPLEGKPLPIPSLPEIPSRLQRLQSLMSRNNLDCLICFGQENSFYIARFNPTIYSNEVIAILRKGLASPILVVNTLRKEKAEATIGHRVVYNYGEWFDVPTKGDTWDEAVKAIVGDDVMTIGYEDNIPVTTYRLLEQAFPHATFEPALHIIQSCRNIKDADEIANARIAAELCNAAMDAISKSLVCDGTEEDAVKAAWNAAYDRKRAKYPGGALNGFGSREGGDFYSIKPWVHYGKRRFLQVDTPNADKIVNEPVSAYIWCAYNGMHAELERTVFVGSVSADQSLALERIKAIRAKVFSMIRPGVPINALYTAACDDMAEFGYALPGRIGHAIGLGGHEGLSINKGTDRELQEGMVLTIEPNVEVLDKNVTTQHSDTIVVTANGYDFLAPYGNDPIRGE